MKYAIVCAGGQQHRVTPGQELNMALPVAWSEQAQPSDTDVAGQLVAFDTVLAAHDGTQFRWGTPHLSGFRVMAEVLGIARGPKIRMVKFKRRKHHMKWQGHRQDHVRVRIAAIDVPAHAMDER